MPRCRQSAGVYARPRGVDTLDRGSGEDTRKWGKGGRTPAGQPAGRSRVATRPLASLPRSTRPPPLWVGRYSDPATGGMPAAP